MLHKKASAPVASNGDLIRERGLCRCDQVRVRSPWSRVGPRAKDCCPFKKRKFGQNDTQGKLSRDDRGRLEWRVYRPRNPRIGSPHWKLGERKQAFLKSLQKEPALLDTNFRASGPQNCGKIPLCCFEHLSLVICQSSQGHSSTPPALPHHLLLTRATP